MYCLVPYVFVLFAFCWFCLINEITINKPSILRKTHHVLKIIFHFKLSQLKVFNITLENIEHLNKNNLFNIICFEPIFFRYVKNVINLSAFLST